MEPAAAAQAPGGRVRRRAPSRPADPNALAVVQIDALDDLSKSMVVDVDNAVRTSDNELTLAVEEFGDKDTAPFSQAVGDAKTTLAQAFNVRQILDDAVPETAAQRRDLLTRVIVAAAKADRELDAQREAFEQLRDLIINAPTRLDAMTQQMVDLTARLEPSEQALTALHDQFSDTALASVAGNVETAKQRLTFADQNITNARNLVSRPVGRQTGLVDAIRAAESALGQARTLLDAVDSAATDINRAIATLPSAIADIQNGIKTAGESAGTGRHRPRRRAQRRPRLPRSRPSPTRRGTGTADPLGAFTKLTQADAELDRLLASVAEEREAAERLSRAFDQALFAAQSRVRAVSDYIDVRRGSIGPEARTRLAEAVRQLQAAQDKRATNLTEAIAHANGAAMLASQAQSMANADAQSAQRSYYGRYGSTAIRIWARCSAASSSATSSPARCAAGSAAAWAAAGARRPTAGPAGAADWVAAADASRGAPLLASVRVCGRHAAAISEFAHARRARERVKCGRT